MSRRTSHGEPAAQAGVPVTYYATCRRIAYLASVGMPQATPYTPPARPQALTLPEPQQTPRAVLPPPPSTPSPAALTTPSRQTVSCSRTTTPRTTTPRATGRRKREVEMFDMDAAYAAFIQRLERQLDAEDAKSA
ncbi:uncharacterized protein Tco025E_02490 [Trypanosoma conorhini]|uniref:Uncharacterized protein n=1 Tax=Trypanosoma conorhini TaxID=83891 RepID=A0A422Q4I7_9TRYP|nr:uncharacterized protein Tco025E_02490 [Trypanosoma conorhini]RNF24877.1 hypothetical protein Tco025E_02490 [Trypanosoma conorhini]